MKRPRQFETFRSRAPPKRALYEESRDFREEQIVRTIMEVEAGARVAETCRKRGIDEGTHYQWKTKIRRPGGAAAAVPKGLGNP